MPEPKDALVDGRTRGWFWEFNDVFNAGLPPHALLVRLYLSRCSDHERKARASVKDIAAHCNFGERVVEDALATLVEKGWIEEAKGPDGPPVYRLL